MRPAARCGGGGETRTPTRPAAAEAAAAAQWRPRWPRRCAAPPCAGAHRPGAASARAACAGDGARAAAMRKAERTRGGSAAEHGCGSLARARHLLRDSMRRAELSSAWWHAAQARLEATGVNGGGARTQAACVPLSSVLPLCFFIAFFFKGHLHARSTAMEPVPAAAEAAAAGLGRGSRGAARAAAPARFALRPQPRAAARASADEDEEMDDEDDDGVEACKVRLPPAGRGRAGAGWRGVSSARSNFLGRRRCRARSRRTPAAPA